MKTTILVLASLAASAFLLGACAGGSDSPEGTVPVTCTPALGKKTLPGSPSNTTSGGMDEVTSFGENPAGLKMYVHAPSGGGGTPSAIILALHGCTQTAAAYVGAGWNELADKQNLVIVYGEQTSTNNSEQCFRWWDDTQITKGGGEAASLASMVTYAQGKYGTKRAFVTGLSAGGAMTTVMLAAYPDLFEAGAIMSGLPYKCATSQIDAYTCMAGKTETPEQWAALVPKSSGAVPRVSVWQGDSDYTVNQKNRDEIVKQWTQVNGISADSPVTTTVGPAKHDEHKDASGAVRVESWTITGMGHGVALDAKSGCGTAAAYELDVGLCSTSHAAEFFLGTVPSSTSSSSSSSSSGGSSGSSGASSGNCH